MRRCTPVPRNRSRARDRRSLGPVSGVLYSAVISPAWLFHDPVTSYNVAKLIGALVMPLAIVPAYLLARLYTGRLPAFAAAVASVAIPGMFYSSLLMQEAVAYPYATLVLYVLARGIAGRAVRGSLPRSSSASSGR